MRWPITTPRRLWAARPTAAGLAYGPRLFPGLERGRDTTPVPAAALRGEVTGD